MTISKLYVENYKIFETLTLELNDDINIFVGTNDTGKTTLLEVISIITTGKLNGFSINRMLKPNLFNYTVRKNYIDSLKNSNPTSLPSIIMEAYFKDGDAEYQGTNNFFNENCSGIRVCISFDDEAYSDIYRKKLTEKIITDIPIEFYKVDIRYFNGKNVYHRYCPIKTAFIDTTKRNYSTILDRFISSNLSDMLTTEQQLELANAYRENRNRFQANELLTKLNSSLKDIDVVENKSIGLGLREENIEEWKEQMDVSVDAIPFENLGFGMQNSIKIELAIKNEKDKVTTILIEEPENNLSFSNMTKLLAKITKSNDKQIFISTHSSFIANKMNLNNLIFLNHNAQPKTFNALPVDTVKYFEKLPGYDTLRFVLAEKVILVEGPSDELIIQRAFFDKYGMLPIEKGIDVISVRSLSFKRFCDIAKLLNKRIAIVTDNDGNIQEYINDKYNGYLGKEIFCFYYEKNEVLNTLEPSILEVNLDESGNVNDDFIEIINSSMKDKVALLKYMKNNKSEWALSVFNNDKKINYPKYILDAIQEYCQT